MTTSNIYLLAETRSSFNLKWRNLCLCQIQHHLIRQTNLITQINQLINQLKIRSQLMQKIKMHRLKALTKQAQLLNWTINSEVEVISSPDL